MSIPSAFTVSLSSYIYTFYRDNGVPRFSAKCSITVDVLDTHNDPPAIEVNPLVSNNAGVAQVLENAAVGRVVALMTVTDTDSGRNGLVTCELNNNFFSLQKLELNVYKV